MGEPVSESNFKVTHLILVPSLITLGITILRVVGELQHWSPMFFGRVAGGGGAIVGISWLPIIFGPYFALKLAGSGQPPTRVGKAIGFAVLALLVYFAGGLVGFAPQLQFPGKEAIGYLIMAGGAVLVFWGWPALFRTLLAYAYAARIPVAIVMFFAIRGNWGTHYDALPPENHGPADLWPKYFQIGLLPQLIFWVAFTVIVGALFGSIASALVRRGKTAPQQT